MFRSYSKLLAESIAEQIGCSPNNIKITPALRVYEFNDVKIPREPRIWLKVRYNATYPVIDKEKLMKKAEGSIVTIQGTTVKPLELFLAEHQIHGSSWIQVQGFNTETYRHRVN